MKKFLKKRPKTDNSLQAFSCSCGCQCSCNIFTYVSGGNSAKANSYYYATRFWK
jgi:putative bacteriocin precursor